MSKEDPQPRQQITRRASDLRLFHWALGIGGAFLIIATVCSVVALVNSRAIARNSKHIEQTAKHVTYARDVAKWHADLNGCLGGSRIVQGYLRDRARDARVIGDNATNPTVRAYFGHQLAPLRKREAAWNPKRCYRRYPKPQTPRGFKELR